MPYTSDFYRGILLRDPRFNASNVTISPATQQAGPVVDAFTTATGSEGYMDLEATGTSTAGQGYEIRCVKPGAAWGEDTGGRYAWRKSADANTPERWMGQYPTPFISSAYAFKAKATAQIPFAWPSAICTSDQFVHVSYSYVTEDHTITNSNHLFCATLDPTTEAWSEVMVDVQALGDPAIIGGEGGVNTYGPSSIVELPSGRLMIFMSDTAATTVRRFYSDDRGATWKDGTAAAASLAGNGIIPPDFSMGGGSSVTNFQVVYHNGYMTMIREAQAPGGPGPGTHTVETDHYVSKDFGANWIFLERFQYLTGSPVDHGTSIHHQWDSKLIVDDTGTVYLIYRLNWDGIGGAPRFLRKFTPYGKFDDDPVKNDPAGMMGIPGGTTWTGDHEEPDADAVDADVKGYIGRFQICKDHDGRLVVIASQGYKSTGPGTYPNRQSTGLIYRYNFSDLRYLADDYRTHKSGWFDCADKAAGDTQWVIFDQVGAPHSGTGAITDYVANLNQSCAVAWKDRILVIGNFSTTEGGGTLQGGTTGAIMAIELGGCTNYYMETGLSTSVSRGHDAARSGITYLPIDAPTAMVADVAGFSSVGFGGAVTGTAFSISVADGLTMTDSGAARHAFQHAGKILHARVRPGTVAATGGGEINSNYAILNGDGVSVRFGLDGAGGWRVQAFDYTGASPVAISNIESIAGYTGALDWIVAVERITVSHSRAFIAYKRPTVRSWTKFATIGDGDSATRTPLGASATGTCRWGHYNTFTRTTHWQFANIYPGTVGDIGFNWGASKLDGSAPLGLANDYHPHRLLGRPFSIYPFWVDDGWKITAKGSAALVDDSWTAATAYEYPIEAAHPEVAAAPRVQWRSVDDDTEITITWAPAAGVASRPLAPVYGLHLSGINFGTFHIEVWNGAAWVTKRTVNTAADFTGLKYQIDGDVVERNAAAPATWAADRYLKSHELVGSYCVFDPGGGSETVRRIATNSEGGLFRTATATPPKSAEIQIEGDPTGIPATGDMDIRQSSVTQLISADTTSYTQFRIRIPVQSTAEGYFMIGAIVLGPVAFFGMDYSHGRLLTLEPNQEITTGRSGDRIVEQLGPHRRRVEFAWTEGWDSRATSGDSPEGYTAVEYAGLPATVREDPSILEGILERSKGAAEPVVYLPRIPFLDLNAASEGPITGRERQMYGRIVSKVTRQVLIGDEDSAARGEVQAVNAITIDEEV